MLKRHSLVAVNATVGHSSTKATTPFHYRVLGVYDKSYNKYYITGEGKKWSPVMTDPKKKKFKLGLRMVFEDALGTYVDVPLDSTTDGMKRKDIVHLIDGSMVLDVIGDLKSL